MVQSSENMGSMKYGDFLIYFLYLFHFKDLSDVVQCSCESFVSSSYFSEKVCGYNVCSTHLGNICYYVCSTHLGNKGDSVCVVHILATMVMACVKYTSWQHEL